MGLDDLIINFEDRIKDMDLDKFVRREMDYDITPEDIDVVVHNLKGIVDHLRGKCGGGHFVTAVIGNDLMDAATRGSGACLRALPVYCRFLYNHVPSDLLTIRRDELNRIPDTNDGTSCRHKL